MVTIGLFYVLLDPHHGQAHHISSVGSIRGIHAAHEEQLWHTVAGHDDTTMNLPPQFCHPFVILVCHNPVAYQCRITHDGTREQYAMHILVVEDNHRLCNSLKMNLEHEGYSVDTAYDGQEGQDFAELMPYDLIILDILLPAKDGLEVCRDLRRRRIHTPILLLTARDSVDDRVHGLDCGADDYLVKPFAMRELLARLRALLRRQQPYQPGRLEMGGLIMDPSAHTVERDQQPIELTPKEYALLEFFLRHPNQVVTRDMIEQHIWNYDFECESNVIDVYVRRLRRKIDDPFAVKLLTTVRGIGYRLTPAAESSRIYR